MALTRKQMIGAGLMSVLMLGLLGLQLVTVERQRRIAARQEVRARLSLDAVREQAQALLRSGGEVAPKVGAGLERADRLVRAFARADSPEAIAQAGELAERLQSADLAGRVELISESVVMLVAQSRDLEAIARETGTDVDVLRAETLEFQRETLGLQRETLGILQRSLTVQEETLVRIRRIDERTGGVLEPAAQR